jgi:hypothetical protein
LYDSPDLGIAGNLEETVLAEPEEGKSEDTTDVRALEAPMFLAEREDDTLVFCRFADGSEKGSDMFFIDTVLCMPNEIKKQKSCVTLFEKLQQSLCLLHSF